MQRRSAGQLAGGAGASRRVVMRFAVELAPKLRPSVTSIDGSPDERVL
jgi:hypothetical protein